MPSRRDPLADGLGKAGGFSTKSFCVESSQVQSVNQIIGERKPYPPTTETIVMKKRRGLRLEWPLWRSGRSTYWSRQLWSYHSVHRPDAPRRSQCGFTISTEFVFYFYYPGDLAGSEIGLDPLTTDLYSDLILSWQCISCLKLLRDISLLLPFTYTLSFFPPFQCYSRKRRPDVCDRQSR